MQKRLDAPPSIPIPASKLLVNSPTFNTLDNRFVEQLNPDSSRLHYVDGTTNSPEGSCEQLRKNLFTNSPWPGLRNDDSIASEPSIFNDIRPRQASQNAQLVSKEDGSIQLNMLGPTAAVRHHTGSLMMMNKDVDLVNNHPLGKYLKKL